MNRLKNKGFFFGICFFLSFVPLFPEQYSVAVARILTSAFESGSPETIIPSLLAAANEITTPAEKKQLLAALAGYEERIGFLGEASQHFAQAAFADPEGRDDSLILDAARCALACNDISQAEGFVRAVLLTCFDEKILTRARVYSAWIQLASAADRDSAISLIKAYTQQPAYSDYAPGLLFTLWWSDNDKKAKDDLIRLYPESPEAAIINGNMELAPVSFWYLMERKQESPFPQTAIQIAEVPGKVTDIQTVPEQPASAGPEAEKSDMWQQVGFFRSRENSEDLVRKLQSLGFKPFIRTTTRPSGTVYYQVLVPEDASHSTGARLKNAGFECFLVFE
ncbi:SPOR domain-containing protein [Brucepastera parasyntrophica]|uniref:SPOR domain-containing protein n=1 Tax=Brucepastera parasyntrophica TaxID=2880008 RepID=UPI00210A929E|nr:SPOR domain-containing protein [Brucepastera parasyntrophica]ULQ60599.1 SPOR domain-containing protein [Brucepastera parasyntrophica]